jgi:hypothetical protein
MYGIKSRAKHDIADMLIPDIEKRGDLRYWRLFGACAEGWQSP